MNTIEIPLTQGFVTVIDAEDWPLVQEHKWSVAERREANSVRYYAQAFIGHTIVLMHRLILSAKPGELVDHANGDGLCNRRMNLRIASTAENGANSKDRERSSGYRGVYPNHGRWMARAGRHYVGTFDTPADAAKARDAKAKELYGDFARCNFSEDCAA